MAGYSTDEADTYHQIWKACYAMLYFNHMFIMFAQIGIQIWTTSSTVNGKLPKAKLASSFWKI